MQDDLFIEQPQPEGLSVPHLVEPRERRQNFAADLEFLESAKGAEFIKQTKRAVFARYDEALVEARKVGDSTLDEDKVRLAKKHLEAVEMVTRTVIETLRTKGIDISSGEESQMLLYAWIHDVEKLTDYFRKDNPRATEISRLLMHGEDSARWFGNYLKTNGFSQEFIQQAQADIKAHMGMPYVDNVLQKELTQNDPAVKKPQDLVDDHYPLPQTKAAAVLFAADLLSPMFVASTEYIIDNGQIKGDPQVGCFDRYVRDNLTWGDNLQQSFARAYASLSANITRLQQGGEKNGKKRDENISRIEIVAGNSIGVEAVTEIHDLEIYISKQLGGFSILQVNEGSDIDVNATMANFYKAVYGFRQLQDKKGKLH